MKDKKKGEGMKSLFGKRKELKEKEKERLEKERKYKEERKERIRKLNKDFVEDLDTLVGEKDGIVDQTRAAKDAMSMELDIERAEAEAARIEAEIRRMEAETKEKHVKIGVAVVGAAATLVTAGASVYYLKKNFDFNCAYMSLIFGQKDSLNILDPKSYNALTKSKENVSRAVDMTMKGATSYVRDIK